MAKVYDLNFEKLPTQAKVYDDDTTKIIVQSMGLGGGKTYNLCMKALKLSYLNRNIAAGGVLAPSMPDFKRDILPTFEEILDSRGIPYTYRDSGKKGRYFQFPWTNKPLYIFTAEKPIAGPNLGYCLINEFSLIRYVRINEMMRRVRVKNCPAMQRILVGTPEDIHGWLEGFIEDQENVEKDKPGTFKIHYGSSLENTHIDDDYVAFLEQTLDEQSLEIFKEGKIGRIGGDFFYYSYDDDRCTDETVVYDKTQHIWVSLDFNVGNMSMAFSHKYGDELHIFDEKVLKGSSDTQAAADYIAATYGKTGLTIVCDSSAKNRKTIADKHGARTDAQILKNVFGEDNVKYKAANPRLKRRQLHLNGMMSNGKIKINPKCKLTRLDFKKVKQLPDYTKDEGKEKQFSHLSDGIDYVIDWLFENPLDRGKKSKSIQI